MFHLKLCYNIKSGQLAQGIETASSCINLIKEKTDHLSPSERMELCFKLAVFYLAIGKPDQAERWNRKVLNEPPRIRPDLTAHSRILSLFIAYDLGVDEGFEHEARNTYRYLYTRRMLSEYERRILKLIKFAFFNAFPYKVERFLRSELPRLEQIFEDPIERRSLAYFDSLTWIRAKLEGITMLEIYGKDASEKKSIIEERTHSNHKLAEAIPQ